MKTFKQILSEARSPARPKVLPKKLGPEHLEIDPKHLGSGETDRGISYQVLHNLPKEHGKLLDTLGGYINKPAVRVKPKYGKPFNTVNMGDRTKRVGAWITDSGDVSYFPHDTVSHGAAKKNTVAAGMTKGAHPVTVSWNSRSEGNAHYHGTQPLTPEIEGAIKDALSRNFGKVNVTKD